jgi:hypothetical protein
LRDTQLPCHDTLLCQVMVEETLGLSPQRVRSLLPPSLSRPPPTMPLGNARMSSKSTRQRTQRNNGLHTQRCSGTRLMRTLVHMGDTLAETKGYGHTRRILKGAKKDQNIRQPSSDMAVGDKVLSAGDTVGPAEVGLLASVGAIRPRVTPQVLPPPLTPSRAPIPMIACSCDATSVSPVFALSILFWCAS